MLTLLLVVLGVILLACGVVRAIAGDVLFGVVLMILGVLVLPGVLIVT